MLPAAAPGCGSPTMLWHGRMRISGSPKLFLSMQSARRPPCISPRRVGCIQNSWTIWRQAAEKNAAGLAAGPEFWARVDSLGDRPYHRPIDMNGLGEGDA